MWIYKIFYAVTRKPSQLIEKTFENSHMTYPHGLHFAVTKIDELTLDINIERYCVYDIGKSVIMLIEGQIVGGSTGYGVHSLKNSSMMT